MAGRAALGSRGRRRDRRHGLLPLQAPPKESEPLRRRNQVLRTLPLPDRFYAGGDYSLRGFKIDSVDPEGGNGLLLGSAELRFDAGRRLSLAAFTDVGNVYPLASDIAFSDLRYAAGFGIRYRSAVGPIRVDLGFKLDRQPDESLTHLHVTVGHAF